MLGLLSGWTGSHPAPLRGLHIGKKSSFFLRRMIGCLAGSSRHHIVYYGIGIAFIAFSNLEICHCLAFLAIGSDSFSCLLSSLLRFLISPLILPLLHPWRGIAGLPLLLARIASFRSLLRRCSPFNLIACGTFTKNRLYFADNSSAGILCDPSL